MNSSRRTSPGWIRMRPIACPSVIIDDLDPFGALAPQSQSAKAHRARSGSATRAGLARARRTANPASDDQDRSARLSPSPRRRGNRSCDRPMAGAHRRCSPAPRGERRPHPRAVGAPIRHQVPLRQQVGQAFPIALLVNRDARVIAAGRAVAARDRPRIAAPPGGEKIACRAVHRALSIVHCCPKPPYDRLPDGKARAHPFRLQPPRHRSTHP